MGVCATCASPAEAAQVRGALGDLSTLAALVALVAAAPGGSAGDGSAALPPPPAGQASINDGTSAMGALASAARMYSQCRTTCCRRAAAQWRCIALPATGLTASAAHLG